jgi:hypothetical protein
MMIYRCLSDESLGRELDNAQANEQTRTIQTYINYELQRSMKRLLRIVRTMLLRYKRACMF